jgi:hypothetical protein
MTPLFLRLLTNPWILAAGGGVAAVALYKRTKEQRGRLKEAKLELIEQQRTIDRLRAEVGRERHLRLGDSSAQY